MLGIGRATLHQLINQGTIGTIQLGSKEKIPHQELVRYIFENTKCERRESLFSSTSKPGISYFINGQEPQTDKHFDSVKLFESLLEKTNG